MKTADAILSVPVEHATLRARLRESGILLACCTPQGQILASKGDPADWLSGLLIESPMARQALRAAAAVWERQDTLQPTEALPGMWLSAEPVINRRRRAAYSVAFILTPVFPASEHFNALCQGAGQDHELARSLIEQLPPVAESEVQRTARFIRDAHHDVFQGSVNTQAVESVGKQLTESYEEMNLLYTMIQSMTVQQRPDRFVTITCEELLKTLPYAWIGAQFASGHEKCKSLADRLIVAGVPPVPRGTLAPLTQSLLQNINAQYPSVIEPRRSPEFAAFAPLGRTVVSQPVVVAGQLIGILLAGEKQGDDAAASNTDMKLLGAAASHTAIFLENAALYDDLNAMFLGTLYALTASIDAKDRYTCGHSRRVAHLTRQLAQAVGMDEHTIERMHIAGLVHDVGKIGVPEAVLLKPGRLNDEEFAWIRRHPEMGHRILKDIPQLRDILPGVLHHHESWDGRGYPHGLKGEGIPLVARLICLADAFDAMSSTRTYRSALSRPEVLREIERCAGRQFDPALAPVFVTLDFTQYDRMVIDDRATESPTASHTGIAA